MDFYSHYSQTNSINQLPHFTTANKLLVKDKFCIELSRNKKKIELTLGDKTCIVKPNTDLVCDTIVRGILPKRHLGLESPSVYVLVTNNKFDFYNITEIANTKYQILDSLGKCNSKKNIYNLSIIRLFNNGFRKRYKKIQIQIVYHNWRFLSKR